MFRYCGELSLNPKCRGWVRGLPWVGISVSLYRFKTIQVPEVDHKSTRVRPVLASEVTSGPWLGTSVWFKAGLEGVVPGLRTLF